ncbi:MAG: ribosome maturation factor RimM [Paludibacteraceae bacterium]|nr:ribosome maturation factor RimM [Paludibacteraceae bacterium]MDY5075277.1 ribosome maturation factor RimM [Paludibacteraceae bacterium]
MIEQNELVRIGTMRRPHGKSGELQCQMDNAFWDEAEADFLILLLDGIFVPFRVEDWRGKGADSLIFRLKGVDTEAKALRLMNAEAYLLRRDLNEEAEEMMTWQDLVGFEVLNSEETVQGRVAAVDESTINTLLELEDGRLLPVHEDLIIEIDEPQKRIILDLPEGL